MAGKKRRGFLTYKSYVFREKDPIIDALRTAFSDSGKSYAQLHEQSGVAASTFHNWFHGKTRKPQFCTISATAIALGKVGIRFRNGKPYFTD